MEEVASRSRGKITDRTYVKKGKNDFKDGK